MSMIMGYSLLGLFVTAVIGSTIFIPFSVEFLFPLFIAPGVGPYQIVLVASLGSLIGTWVNYWLGAIGAKIIKRRVSGEKIGKAKRLMDRYGWFGLLVIITVPLPIPVDGVTVVPGITRMNFLWFSIVVFAGKVLKYSLFVRLLDQILGIIWVI